MSLFRLSVGEGGTQFSDFLLDLPYFLSYFLCHLWQIMLDMSIKYFGEFLSQLFCTKHMLWHCRIHLMTLEVLFLPLNGDLNAHIVVDVSL